MKSLVLSGGGSKGAYQAGVIRYLCLVKKYKFDAYYGTSVGSINAAHMAQYCDKDIHKAVDTLVELWFNINTEDVRKDWALGDISVLWKPSRYNSNPLHHFIRNHLDQDAIRKSGKGLGLCAVSLDTGKCRVFDETTDHIPSAVLASSAYPVMLLPVNYDGELWTDGGVRDVTPLSHAIKSGSDEIVVVLCTPEEDVWSPLKNPNAVDILSRILSIMTEEIIENDLKLALYKNELAKKGNSKYKYVDIKIVRPDKSLGVGSLNFNPEDSKRLVNQGFQDAKDQLKVK